MGVATDAEIPLWDKALREWLDGVADAVAARRPRSPSTTFDRTVTTLL
jgi:hypothetical protein